MPRLDRGAVWCARNLAFVEILLLTALPLERRGASAADRTRTLAGAVAAVCLATAGVAALGKVANRTRPFAQISRGEHPLPHRPDRSFPSRHAACAAALTAAAARPAPRIGSIMGTLGLILSVSRVYAGLHYPSDVIAGWLLGTLCGLVARQATIRS